MGSDLSHRLGTSKKDEAVIVMTPQDTAAVLALTQENAHYKKVLDFLVTQNWRLLSEKRSLVAATEELQQAIRQMAQQVDA